MEKCLAVPTKVQHGRKSDQAIPLLQIYPVEVSVDVHQKACNLLANEKGCTVDGYQSNYLSERSLSPVVPYYVIPSIWHSQMDTAGVVETKSVAVRVER